MNILKTFLTFFCFITFAKAMEDNRSSRNMVRSNSSSPLSDLGDFDRVGDRNSETRREPGFMIVSQEGLNDFLDDALHRIIGAGEKHEFATPNRQEFIQSPHSTLSLALPPTLQSFATNAVDEPDSASVRFRSESQATED